MLCSFSTLVSCENRLNETEKCVACVENGQFWPFYLWIVYVSVDRLNTKLKDLIIF